MITIDKYLAEYREYMFTKDLIIRELNNRDLTRSDIYVITEHSYYLIKSLLNSTVFLDTALIDIEEEIEDIFKHINSKLDKILELSEAYQKLNTSELLEEPINSFSVFDIKASSNYNTYFKALTLKNTTKTRVVIPNVLTKTNKNTKEVYLIDKEIEGDFIQFKKIKENNTLLKGIHIYDVNNNLINTFQEFSMISLDKSISRIEVITDNADLNNISFTQGSVYNPYYQKHSSIKLNSIIFNKEGSLFKLNSSYTLPTECYITAKITFEYKDSNTNQPKQETLYISLDNSQEVLVEKQEIDSLKVLYTQIEDKTLLEPSLIYIKPLSTNTSIVNFKGYNVFDISKINAKEFTVSITLELYSLLDKNKTPSIEGIYGYVTK